MRSGGTRSATRHTWPSRRSRAGQTLVTTTAITLRIVKAGAGPARATPRLGGVRLEGGPLVGDVVSTRAFILVCALTLGCNEIGLTSVRNLGENPLRCRAMAWRGGRGPQRKLPLTVVHDLASASPVIRLSRTRTAPGPRRPPRRRREWAPVSRHLNRSRAPAPAQVAQGKRIRWR